MKTNMRIFVIARVSILFLYLSLTAFGGVLNTYVNSTRATSKESSGFFIKENSMKEILLNTVYKTKNYKKYSAMVDDEDYESLSRLNWCVANIRNTLYAINNAGTKTVYMHNFITGYEMTDHKDGNGLNNQKSNLREVTHSQNMMNVSSYRGSQSQYKGVHKGKRDKKWQAQIKYKRKNINIGRFDTEIDAAKAYNQKAVELFGAFAKLNKV